MGTIANTYFSTSLVIMISYFLMNGYNLDKSIDTDAPGVIAPFIKKTEELSPLVKVSLFLITLFIYIILILIDKSGTNITMVLNIIILLGMILIVFLFSTINYNSKLDKTCYLTQMTLFDKKYSTKEGKDDEQNRRTLFQNIDSSLGFRILYFIGLIAILVSNIVDKSFNIFNVSLFVVLYFLSCLLIQLVPSFILKLYSDYREWPSFFNYLDQSIQNNNDPRRYVFSIIGGIRLLILLVMSIYVSYYVLIRNKTISHTRVFLFIIFSWFIFLFYLSFWQIFVGDGCIIERTMEEHKRNKKEGSLNLDIEYSLFKDALVCSVDNQFGIYSHFILFSICLTVIGFKAK